MFKSTAETQERAGTFPKIGMREVVEIAGRVWQQISLFVDVRLGFEAIKLGEYALLVDGS